MINRTIYKSSFLAAGLLFSLLLAAQNTTIKATISKPQMLIGEQITLTLEADIPESQPIRFFSIDSLPHFEILRAGKIDTANTSGGTSLSQTILITSFDSGHWVIPPLVLSGNIITDSLGIDVGYSPFDPAQDYHDIKDIIEVAPPEKPKRPWWWYAIGAVLVVATVLYFILRGKKKPVVAEAVKAPADPYKEAMQQLEALQQQKPDAKQYYSQLTDIFRMYVLKKKAIHSLQKTTDDLVVQLKSLNISKEQFEKLSQSLRLSDFVKFAKYVPSAEDDINAWDAVKKSIDTIEQIP